MPESEVTAAEIIMGLRAADAIRQSMQPPALRIEPTRFTITPPIDVVDVHNVQVHVEQRRDGSWTAAYQGWWFDAEGLHHVASGVNAARCSHDFATAMRIGAEAARGIAERYRRDQ